MEAEPYELADAVQIAAVQVAQKWGVDVDDLVQDLWFWYYEPRQRTARVKLDEAWSKAGAVRILAHRANQILSAAALENDRFNGKDLYPPDTVKDELKGEGTNKYLKHILPFALDCLAAKLPDYREAIRERYDDGVVHTGAKQVRLVRAIEALTKEVNGIYLAGVQVDQRRPDGETRRATGGHGDPTADMALSLITAGDLDILIYNREGEIVDHTTLRDEFLADNFQMGTTGRSSTDQDSLFDGMFSDIERAAMYKAQVFPEEFPEERRMLTENWPQEDLEAYCGGEHTVGYRRLSVVR